MTTILGPPAEPALKQFQPADLPQQIPESTPATHRMHIPPDTARELDRYISIIVKRFQEAFDRVRQTQGAEDRHEITLDLSGVSEVPHSSLVFLVRLLRRTLGEDVSITLSGVSTAILGPLIAFGLPRYVTVVDSRLRRWPG